MTIVTESGDILRKFEIDTGFYLGRLLLHEDKLCSVLVSEPSYFHREIDEVYLFDVRQLLSSGLDKVVHKTLFSSHHKFWTEQKYALGRTSITRLSIENEKENEDCKNSIKLKTLNFWSAI